MLRTPRNVWVSVLVLCGLLIGSTRVIAQLPPPKELPETQKKDGDKKPPRELPEILVTNPVKKESIVINEYRPCKLAPHREIKFYSSIPNGVISEVVVKEGQKVKKGEVLFKFMSSLYQAKQDLELAEVKIAQIECENAIKLYQQKVISAGEMELCKAKLAKAQAKAKVAEVELNKTILHAPFDGEVGKISVTVGSQVKETEVLTTLSDHSIMSAYFKLPVERYPEYKRNLDQEVELKITDEEKVHLKGKLVSILPPDNKDSDSMNARAEFPNPDRLLFTGQNCMVIVKREFKNVLIVPKEISGHQLFNGDLYKLHEQEHRLNLKQVEMRYEGADYYVLLNDASETDRIIYEGWKYVGREDPYKIAQLKPKQPVKK